MSKETKPKSEGCRWKVLWTLLLGFLLFGASNASAYNVTFIFNIPQADYSRVSILDDGAMPTGMTVPSDGVLEFSGTGGYFVGIPAPSYTMTKDPAASFQTADFGYALGDGLNYTRVELWGDGTLTFQTPDFGVEPEPSDDNSITLNFTGETNAYQNVWIQNTTEYTANDGKWYIPTGDSDIWNYEFNKDGVASLVIGSKPGYSIDVKCNTPGLVNALETGDYYLVDLNDGAGGYSFSEIDNPNSQFGGGWQLEIYNEKVNGASFTVTLTQNSYPVYFKVVAGEGVPSKNANKPLGESYSFIVNGVKNVTGEIFNNAFTYHYAEGSNAIIEVSVDPGIEPEDEYEVVVSSSLKPGPDTYEVTYSRVGYFSIGSAQILLHDGAAQHLFTLTVQKNGATIPEPAEAELKVGESFVPATGTEYNFKAAQAGTLRIEAAQLSRAIANMSGVLYLDGVVVAPVQTDGTNVGDVISNFSYVEYEVLADTDYYFVTTNNSGNSAVTATFEAAAEPGPEPVVAELPVDETFEAVAGSVYTYDPEVNGKLSIYYDQVGSNAAYFYVLKNGEWDLISEDDMADVPWNGPDFKGVYVYYIQAGEQYKFAPAVDGTFTTAFVESTISGGGEPVEFMLSIGEDFLSDDPEFLSPVETPFQYFTIFGENVELAPNDEYGNSPLAFINIYGVDDEWQMGVAGVDTDYFANGQFRLWEPFELKGDYIIEFKQDGIFIIDGNPSIAKKFYFTTGETEIIPTTLFARGAFNDYNVEDAPAAWQLVETGEGTNVYVGQFEIPAGEFEFNLQTNEGMIYRYAGEGQAPSGTGEGEEERPGVMIMPVTFTNNVYEAGMEMALGGEQNFFWANETWNGGSITVTANLNNNTIKIDAQEDVEIDPNAPVRMYVLGGFDINNSVLTPNPSTDQELILNEETGLYEGMVENWLGQTGSGINAKRNGKIFYTAVNGIYTFYGAQANSTGFRNLNFEYEGQTLDFDIEAAEASYLLRAFALPTSQANTSKDIYVQVSLEDMQASFTWGYPETVPALVADNFEMIFTEGQTTPVTTDVYISLENVEEMYSYAGYQFDITLPFGMEVTSATLGTGIVGMEGYEKPISVAQVNNMPPTTYRVVGFFDPTTATENIAKLTISGVYNEEMVNGEEYPVTIQNTVVFSTPLGEDRKDVEGSVSTVTIYIENKNATGVDIKSCRLLWPSYTSREGDIEYITEGQAVELTAVLEPTDAADEITWTATVDGSDNLGIQVSSPDEDDTQNLKVVVATDWELLNLQSPVTVVIRAQGVDEEVYDEYALTVNPIVLGDANDNGKVNVADVVTTANYIANADTPATIAQFVEEFDLPNADVNQNNNSMEGSVNGINVTDVTAIVNIALGTQTGRGVRRHTGSYVSADRLVAARVSDSSIAVALDGQTAYAALQVEIEMPAGMSVYGVEKGARAAGHELTYGVNASGNVVVVLYSLDNSSFAGEGSLFTLQVEGGNAEDMRLVNVFASDAQSNGYELEGLYSSEVTGIFGIDAELASGVRYFTVDGVQVQNPEKGQILIRVAGNKVEKTIIK